MEQRVIIKVLLPDSLDVGKSKVLFKCVRMLDDAVDFDYKSVIKGLRCLYPDERISIAFEIGK